MTHRVNRAELLQRLEMVQPGISPRDIVEQSSSFVFKDGYVITYNDEIACRATVPLPKDFTGAVQAAPLLTMLRKLPEDELEVSCEGGEFRITGKKRKAGVRMDATITLPVEAVEPPDAWLKVPEGFSTAIEIVTECAGRDESSFAMTCIHFHPKWLEACDNYQLARYKIKLPIRESFLIRRDAANHVVALGMTEFCETASWVHFKSPVGLVLSCRRFTETYPDLKMILDVQGSPITLPGGLNEAADKAQVFSSENADDDQVLVELQPGKMRIRGTGTSGWYSEVKKLKYDGPPMSFQISPKLLIQLTERHNDCLISEGRLLVDGGVWRYVTCLNVPNVKADKVEEVEGAE